jgi:hypothetical protein
MKRAFRVLAGIGFVVLLIGSTNAASASSTGPPLVQFDVLAKNRA